MTIRRIRYASSAREDLRRIRAYITQQNGDTREARRIDKALRTKAQSLARAPFSLGTLVPEYGIEGLRMMPYGNFTFFIRYTEVEMDVIAILWGGREPSRYFERLT